jgi:hypothetical protein
MGILIFILLGILFVGEKIDKASCQATGKEHRPFAYKGNTGKGRGKYIRWT